MIYRIRTTAQAESDIVRLYQAIAARQGDDAALAWYEAYIAAMERLVTMPLSCGLAYENPDFPVELRHLLFGVHPRRRYRALFTVHGGEVILLTIRAPGERPIAPDDPRIETSS